MKNTDYYQYDVVLSFAGEDRSYAEALAKALRSQGIKVFYDKYEKAELWGKNLSDHLSTIYQYKARYCVMFISRHYSIKLWTNFERKVAQSRAFSDFEEYILPIRLDETQIPGILQTIGYLSWKQETVESITDSVLKKLGRIPQAPKPSSLISSHSKMYREPREQIYKDQQYPRPISRQTYRYLPLLKGKLIPSITYHELPKLLVGLAGAVLFICIIIIGALSQQPSPQMINYMGGRASTVAVGGNLSTSCTPESNTLKIRPTSTIVLTPTPTLPVTPTPTTQSTSTCTQTP